jgi:hypothetical protein
VGWKKGKEVVSEGIVTLVELRRVEAGKGVVTVGVVKKGAFCAEGW